jgi:hypothetical protein
MAPSLASIGRDEARASAPFPSPTGATRDGFLSLWEKCIVARYHACVGLQYCARRHEISILCRLPASARAAATSLVNRRRHRCSATTTESASAAASSLAAPPSQPNPSSLRIRKLIFIDSAVSMEPPSFDSAVSMTPLRDDSAVPLTPLSHDSAVSSAVF